MLEMAIVIQLVLNYTATYRMHTTMPGRLKGLIARSMNLSIVIYIRGALIG